MRRHRRLILDWKHDAVLTTDSVPGLKFSSFHLESELAEEQSIYCLRAFCFFFFPCFFFLTISGTLN